MPKFDWIRFSLTFVQHPVDLAGGKPKAALLPRRPNANGIQFGIHRLDHERNRRLYIEAILGERTAANRRAIRADWNLL